MKTAPLRSFLPYLIAAFAALFAVSCKKPAAIKPETTAAYGQTALNFCSQIVECEKEEMRQRLVDDVQRRTYLEGRMTDAACIEERLRSIEQRPSVTDAIPLCTTVLSSASACADKIRLLRENEHCRSVLNL